MGRVRRGGLVRGGVSLGMSFEFSKAPIKPRVLSLLYDCVSRCELSTIAPAPYLPAAELPTMMVSHTGNQVFKYISLWGLFLFKSHYHLTLTTPAIGSHHMDGAIAVS